MSFFDAFKLAGNSPDAKSGDKGPSPTLRADLYKAIEATQRWLSTPGAAGDGISFRQVYDVVQPHVPSLRPPMPLEEVAILVGTITDLTFELGKADGMSGVMVVQTWTETLKRALGQLRVSDKAGAERIGDGIVRGVDVLSNPSLMTRDLGPRVQYVNTLKGVAAFVYGAGSGEARQAEAYWSSKMLM